MAVVPLGFKVGDLVRWTSASRGVWRHHVGVVVALVPAGELPCNHRPAGARWAWHCLDNVTRPHLSFLVAEMGTPGRVGKLYRPRVRYLRHHGSGDAPMVVTPSRARPARAQAAYPVVWCAPVAPAWRRPALIAARAVAALLFVMLVAGLRGLP